MTFNFISFEFVRSNRASKTSRSHGKTRRGRIARSEHNERELQMKQLFLSGKTLEEIAVLQNPIITRERVRQILKKRFGLTGQNGGKFVSTISKIICIEKNKVENEERRYQNIFGCSKELFLEINGCEWNYKKGTPAMAYYQQRRNAINGRNIEWNISFTEWWYIWKESGHYEERGRGKGYCMARIGDTGGYTKDNVKIITIGENFSESFLKYSQEHRRNKAIENGKNVSRFEKKEYCKRGHKLEGDNLYITKTGRLCKACIQIRNKNYYHAHKPALKGSC